MERETCSCIQRNSDGACADGDMRISDAHHIGQQRNGENGATSADQPQRQAHKRARPRREKILQQGGGHARRTLCAVPGGER